MINTQRPPELYLPIDFSNWLPGTINSSFNELEVWAMSFYDEILLKNPDGLMNGKAMADVIQRCIPAISNPWQIPENDYRYITVALSLATYGAKTTFRVNCAHCKESNEYELNLQKILSDFNQKPATDFSVESMHFKLGNATYKDIVTYRNNNYGLLKSISSIRNQPENSFDVKLLKDELSRYRKNELWLKSRRIKQIAIDNYEPIVNSNQILGLLENFNKQITNEIDSKLSFYKVYQRNSVKCSSCGKTNAIDLNLDPSDHFFNRVTEASDHETESIFDDMDKAVKSIHREIARIVWFMRGSVSFSECLKMSPTERNALVEQIQENIETSKKTKVPIF